jgi:hypothetical protein
MNTDYIKDLICHSDNETSFFVNKNVELDKDKLSIEKKIIINKKRCNLCNKRITLATEFTCKCSGIFCSLHKYPDTHNCSFDHKAEWKKSLKEKNPTVSGEKIEKI